MREGGSEGGREGGSEGGRKGAQVCDCILYVCPSA